MADSFMQRWQAYKSTKACLDDQRRARTEVSSQIRKKNKDEVASKKRRGGGVLLTPSSAFVPIACPDASPLGATTGRTAPDADAMASGQRDAAAASPDDPATGGAAEARVGELAAALGLTMGALQAAMTAGDSAACLLHLSRLDKVVQKLPADAPETPILLRQACSAGLMTMVGSFLRGTGCPRSADLQSKAAWTLLNVSYSDDLEVLSRFEPLLGDLCHLLCNSQEYLIRENAAWCLANLAGDSRIPFGVMTASVEGPVETLLRDVRKPDGSVSSEAVWMVSMFLENRAVRQALAARPAVFRGTLDLMAALVGWYLAAHVASGFAPPSEATAEGWRSCSKAVQDMLDMDTCEISTVMVMTEAFMAAGVLPDMVAALGPSMHKDYAIKVTRILANLARLEPPVGEYAGTLVHLGVHLKIVPLLEAFPNQVLRTQAMFLVSGMINTPHVEAILMAPKLVSRVCVHFAGGGAGNC